MPVGAARLVKGRSGSGRTPACSANRSRGRSRRPLPPRAAHSRLNRSNRSGLELIPKEHPSSRASEPTPISFEVDVEVSSEPYSAYGLPRNSSSDPRAWCRRRSPVCRPGDRGFPQKSGMRSGLEDVGLYESSGRGTRDRPTQVPTQIVRVQLVRLPQAFFAI